MRGFVSGRRWAGIALVAFGASAGAALLIGAPAAGSAPEEAQAAGITRARVVALAGGEPDRCVYSAPSLELCTWTLDGRLFSPGQPTSPERSGNVNLVCELPIGGANAVVGSCAAHARSRSDAEELPPVSAAPLASAARSGALRLASAGTVRELSNLVGDAPDGCRSGAESQTCTWTISEQTPSYELFAALIEGDGPVALRCVLPMDGSPRGPESCDVVALD